MNKFSHITICLAIMSIIVTAANTARGDDEKEQRLIDILKSDSPKAEKAITCKRLAIYGGKDCVGELAKLLPDPQLNSWARIALEAIPGREADAALRSAIPKLKSRVLIGVINSVGVRRDAEAAGSLTKLLDDPDAGVASSAALALGRIGTEQARTALEQSLPIARPGVRTTVAEGCILCAEKLMAEGHGEKAAALYDKVRTADVPKQRIAEATRGAILARKEAGVPLLVEQLQSGDKAMFNTGLMTARELAGSKATEAIVDLLGEATPRRRALLIVALAERDDPTVLPAVLKAAQSGLKAVRVAALGMLPRLGDVACIDTLLAAAVDDDSDLAKVGKTGLENLPGQAVDADLAARLTRASGKERRVLIELAGLRRMDVTPELIKAAGDADAQTRAAALAALGETVDDKDLDFLIERVVVTKSAADAPAAQRALRAACIRMPDREACAADIIAAMSRCDLPTKNVMLEIIGDVGGTKSLAAVGAAAKSPETSLQDTATRVLGKWTSVDAAPVLLDLAVNLPKSKFKVRAMRGYIRFIRQSKLPVAEKLAMCRKALAAADRVQEKQLVLDTLPRFKTADSLALAADAAAAGDVREVAAKAALSIAKSIADKEPGAVVRAMDKLTASGVQGDLLDQAEALSGSAKTRLKK